jgi:hypothetical protein
MKSLADKDSFIPKVTFLAKNATVCPVCEHSYFQETLLSGGGRLIADIVTETLHRKYRPSKTFGKIYPLIYSITVCPSCYFASLGNDFNEVPEGIIKTLKKQKNERIELANKLSGKPVDFTKYRTLESGAAGYAIAVMCYDLFSKKSIPVIKQAICSIRAAYLFEELEQEKPNQYFNYLAELFYKKALFFYKRAMILNQSKEQVMETLKTFGPDLDKNYGYDGIIYLIGVLTYKYGIKTNKEIRKQELIEARTYLSKLFGFGKTDYDKPKEIVEKAKEFYELIAKELKSIDGTE